MKLPLVSVIVPTKNSEYFLKACLLSIQKQTYENIELIVVDNNSIDQTKFIAKEFTTIVLNKGPERSAQRNYGAHIAMGEYIVFIDSDMELDSRVIEQCVEKIKSNPLISGIIVPEESFGTGFWAQCKKLERSFYLDVAWMEAARFFSKKIFTTVKGYNSDLISGEDWDLSNRISHNGKIERINAFIYHNEGEVSLIKLLHKKLYYAKEISNYKDTNDNKNSHLQFNVVERYKLFFKKPDKLFKNPFISLGMLYMKTLEFGIGGLVYLLSLRKKHEKYS